MPSVNFRELLSVPTDTVERPKAFPECWLNAKITNHEFGQSPRRKTPYVRFFFSPQSIAADPKDPAGSVSVTEDDLEGIDFTKRELRKDFFITVDARWRLADFLDAVMGKETGRTFNERIPETRGGDVILHVTQRLADDNSETIYNDVQEVLAA